jgi:hypothetical protein
MGKISRRLMMRIFVTYGTADTASVHAVTKVAQKLVGSLVSGQNENRFNWLSSITSSDR